MQKPDSLRAPLMVRVEYTPRVGFNHHSRYISKGLRAVDGERASAILPVWGADLGFGFGGLGLAFRLQGLGFRLRLASLGLPSS